MTLPPPLPLEEAQARLIALAPALPVETVAIEQAQGRYLAKDLHALRTQPAGDVSAMDGYAVRLGDLVGPWRVIGESAAGHPFGGSPQTGEAVRISTGALLPEGAGCVIVQEDTAREGNTLRLTGEGPLPPDKHVRKAGLDFRTGDQVLQQGTLLGPAQAALALSAGHGTFPVRRLPCVVIIDSGDELATSEGVCAPHEIPASNGAMLVAMVRGLAGEARRIGPVPDQLDALQAAFDEARACDVIVTSGGASVGDHDLIRPALDALGARLDFWRIAIKPGKPLLVATRDRPGGTQIIVGLPGNSVSSFVTAYLFVLPLLRAMAGAADPRPRAVTARLAAPLAPVGDRREFVRARWDGECVVPQRVQDSGALASLAASNALIDRPAHAPEALPGEPVRIFLTANGGNT
jgi:molybdopterin molybdotransferase